MSFRKFLLVTILATICFAEKVYLNNGDVVSGKIKSMAAGKLTIATDLFGDVQVDMANIKTFQTDEANAIELSDGSVLKQKAVADDEGNISTIADVGSDQKIGIKDIAAINPPKPEQPKWEGSLQGGFFYSSGNTSKDSYNLGTSLKKITDIDRINIKADTVQSREKTAAGDKEKTEDWWKITGKYDYFISEDYYLYGNAEYKKDTIAELDRRVIIGGGLGKKIFDIPDDFTLDIELGLANVYERYENQNAGSEMSLRAAYNMFKRISNTVVFNHGLEYYPHTDSFSDYNMSTFGELKMDVAANIFTSYRVVFDYDSTPSANSTSTDLKHLLSFGVNF